MTRPPIFAATLADHGLRVEPRPLGAVSLGLNLVEDGRVNVALTAALNRMLANTLCRRCDGAPESNRTCAACCAELVALAERDAEARTVMASLHGMFDPMTGRPVGGGW